MKHRTRTRQSATLPAFVRTAEGRQKSELATSPNVLRAHAARRGAPIIVPDTVKRWGGVTRLSHAESLNLLIDTRYQREEITGKVNTMIHALKSGGKIPDPISVARRKYGDRRDYIVDGQQRWWAHVDCSLPVEVIYYEVESLDDEELLYHALNATTRLTPANRLQSWPKAAGQVVRRLNEDAASPLAGRISFGEGSSIITAPTLLKVLGALITGTTPLGGIDRIMPAFDMAYERMPKRADMLIGRMSLIIAALYDNDHRMRQVPAVALAKVAARTWKDATTEREMALPTPTQIGRLKRYKWEAVAPTSSVRYLPAALVVVQDIWTRSEKVDF